MSSLLISPGPVTTVTLNRPDVRNAFNEELIRDLTEWAERVPSDGSVRVAVLQGAGSVFCAGADLNWMSKMVGYSREENLDDARRAVGILPNAKLVLIPRAGHNPHEETPDAVNTELITFLTSDRSRPATEGR